MSAVALIVLIITGLIGLFIIWKILKPYFIKHDTTLLITGGLGSGKTLTAVKQAIILLRKNRYLHWTWHNRKVEIQNYFIRLTNTKRKKKAKKLAIKQKTTMAEIIKSGQVKKLKPKKAKRAMPLLYSNIPIHFKKHIFGREREWSVKLTEYHCTCLQEIRQKSIVVIDEMPQFINQFNWNEKVIQHNVNEFITFFRHYIQGYMIITAQSQDDIVCQIRRKLNQCTWCFNFKKHFFGLFYTIEMCDIMLSDNISTISTTFIEDNTHKYYGMFPARKTYDTHCYSERYKNILEKAENMQEYEHLKTNKVLRLQKYISPLDDRTTIDEKNAQHDRIKDIIQTQEEK